MDWKVGDWCFCEYKLSQIKRVSDGIIKEISDGACSMSGNNLNDRCFPLEMDIKNLSDETDHWNRRIAEAEGRKNLNWPDIHGMLVELWANACRDMKKQERYKPIQDFAKKIIEKCEELDYQKVDGISLFRK